MKKVLFLSVILVMILSGCNFSTPADIDFDESGRPNRAWAFRPDRECRAI